MKLSKEKRERKGFFSISDVLEGRELLRPKLALSAQQRSISPRNGITPLKMGSFWLVRTCLCSQQCGVKRPLLPALCRCRCLHLSVPEGRSMPPSCHSQFVPPPDEELLFDFCHLKPFKK